MSGDDWTWLHAASAHSYHQLGREVDRRAGVARKQRRRQSGIDRDQDARLDALEERAARLESLVVFLTTRLADVGAIDEDVARELYDGLHDHLGDAELTPIDAEDD